MSVSILDRLKIASRAVVGAFEDTTRLNTDTHGLLSAIFPNDRGDAPNRGTKSILEAYSDMPWLRACSSKIATAISSTQWRLYVNKREGQAVRTRGMQIGDPLSRLQARKKSETVEVEEHILLEALNYGNSIQTGRAMVKTIQLHLDLVGDAFLLKQRNGVSAPEAFWPIPPDWIKSTPTPQQRSYEVGFRGWQGYIPDTEILWMADPNPANPYGRGSGLGNVLSDELETNEYAGRHLRTFFFNRARPDLIISPKQKQGVDTPLRPEEVERLEHDWLSKNQGFWRAFKPYFVSREIDVKELATDFRSMQFTELRSAQRDIIIQTFGVPPEILGVIENSNRATIDAADYLFAKYVLTPRLEFLRSVFQERLIPEYDDRLIIDYDSPVQEDRQHALEAAKTSVGVLSVDEWRELSGFDPLPDEAGKTHLVPNNLVQVDIGEPAPPPPPPPEEPPPAIEPETPLAETPEEAEEEEAEIEAEAEKSSEPEQKAVEISRISLVQSDSIDAELKEVNLQGDLADLPPLSALAGRREPAVMRQLMAEWADIYESIDLDELETAVRSDRVMQHMKPFFERVDASFLAMQEPLQQMYVRGAQFAAQQLDIPIQKGVVKQKPPPGYAQVPISFNNVNAAAVQWAHAESMSMVEDNSRTDVKGIQQVLGEGVAAGWGPDKVARQVREHITSTRPQHRAATKRRNTWLLEEALKVPKGAGDFFTLNEIVGSPPDGKDKWTLSDLEEAAKDSAIPDLIYDGLLDSKAKKRIDKRAKRFREAQNRQRAKTIARTEMIGAANAGQEKLWERGIEKGWLEDDEVEREWLASVDERIEVICEGLDGTRSPIGKGELFGGTYPHPPAHPNCRCAMGLVDREESPTGQDRPHADSPLLTPLTQDESDALLKVVNPEAVEDTYTAYTTKDPVTGKAVWTDARSKLHDQIVEEAISGVKPKKKGKRTVYMMGGGPASGKSTMLEGGQVKMPGHPHAVKVDPDEFKLRLPEYKAMVKYKTITNKDGKKERVIDVERSDNRAARFSHEESSYIAKRITARATELGLDVVIDGTGDSSYAKLRSKVAGYRKHGHKVVARYATNDMGLAEKLADARATKTGRKVPMSYLRRTHHRISSFMSKALDDELFDDIEIYDTNVHKKPRLVVSGERGSQVIIHDEALWKDFLAKRKWAKAKGVWKPTSYLHYQNKEFSKQQTLLFKSYPDDDNGGSVKADVYGDDVSIGSKAGRRRAAMLQGGKLLAAGNRNPDIIRSVRYDITERSKTRAKDQVSKKLAKHPAVKKLTRSEAVRALAALEGLDEDEMTLDLSLASDTQVKRRLTSRIVSNWAGTSGDNRGDAIAFQEIIADQFPEASNSERSHFEAVKARKGEGWETTAPHKSRRGQHRVAYDSVMKERAAFQSVFRAMYDNTQRELARAGLTHITVFRGVQKRSGITDPFKQGKGKDLDYKNGVVVAARLQPASSTSVFPIVADDFSNQDYVLAMRVPASQVLSYPRTGFGCLDEGEFVVLGARTPSFAMEGAGSGQGFLGDDMLDRIRQLEKVTGDTKTLELDVDRMYVTGNLDATGRNQDWIKVGQDMTSNYDEANLANLRRAIKAIQMTVEDFKKLPAFTLAVKQSKESGMPGLDQSWMRKL